MVRRTVWIYARRMNHGWNGGAPHVTLGQQLNALAPGLTLRSVLEKFATVQMIDLYLPTTDGGELDLTRYTQPEPELKLPLDKLKLNLPVARPSATENQRRSRRDSNARVVQTF
jgi:hypothetical protein